jgi:hypothetical protein
MPDKKHTMASDFYIDLSVQTDQGPTRIGRFNIGQDREKARELFKKMMGSGKYYRQEYAVY